MRPFPPLLLVLLAVALFLPWAAIPSATLAQEAERPVVRLWEADAPLAQGTTEKDIPTLTIYRPKQPNGTAVVICPGGGYVTLAVDHEGRQVGEWLNSLGVTGFVLRYRVAPYKHPVPLADAQRAVRLVRSRAAEWGISPEKIGMLGFSAGGHLTSTALTHFEEPAVPPRDEVDRQSARPDFGVLCYPVISFVDASVHAGSARNLLGPMPEESLRRNLSNELQVTERTPPAFLMHTNADTGVPPENSVLFYLALRKAKVPAELHIFEPGKHGLGLAPGDPVVSAWPKLCERWMRHHGWIGPEGTATP